MFFAFQLGEPRPTIITKNKDESYHARWARYCIGSANNQMHTEFVEKTKRNKRFYAGKQWEGDEDVELFLRDENNNERNRLTLTNNIIRPMIEQYRGNAIRMGINFRVKSISPQVINRREQALGKSMFMSRQASAKGMDGQENPFAPEIRKNYPVGKNDAETIQTFENSYVDKVVKKMNNLCGFVSNKNNFDDKQVRIAEELAFSGIGVVKNYEKSGHQVFRVVESEKFFWDGAARQYDLNDAGFMGEFIEMWPQEIFEAWPNIGNDTELRESIENFSIFYSQISNQVNSKFGQQFCTPGKVPVFFTYWMDGQYDEFGYVLDEYGYEYFTKINFTREGEEKPRYTDADLIQSKSIKAKKLLGNSKKKTMFYEVVRMAAIIPREILASAKKENQQAVRDVVLEYGMEPYQEVECDDISTSKFPYKCYCWGYVDGEVLSPIDDAIDPQRFINRIWSVAENQINNSRGAGVVYDSSMVDDEAEMLNNMNMSRPLKINAKGKGIQNSVGQYDATVKSGTTVLYNIIDATKNSLQQTTGINEAIQGQSTGSDQLVGVTQLMIQRGSLMQEPFYNAITLIFKQCYQAICTRGKRIYADSERNLAIAAGDDGVDVIRITKDMNLEDFRIFVKRENPDEILINAANQTLLLFKQLNMLDEKSISNLWGRSTPDEVASALREWAKTKEEIQKMSAEKAQQEQNNLMSQAQDEQNQQKFMMHDQQAREDIKNHYDKKSEMDKELLKALSKISPGNKAAEGMIMNAAKNNLQNQRL